MSTDLNEEVRKIKNALQALKDRFGEQVEYVLLGSTYNQDKVYQGGFELIHVREQRTFYFYKETIKNASNRHRELVRFLEFAALGEFRVVCKNEGIDDEKLDWLIEHGGDWVVKGREYVVTKITKNTDGLTFSLRELDGRHLIYPDPNGGYSSIRFEPADYAKLN